MLFSLLIAMSRENELLIFNWNELYLFILSLHGLKKNNLFICRIFLISMQNRVRSWIDTGKNGSWTILKDLMIFFKTKQNCPITYFIFFFAYFMLKLYEPCRDQEILKISTVHIWSLRVKKFFLQFLVVILPLGSWSGCRNIVDPSDPDPKHWYIG